MIKEWNKFKGWTVLEFFLRNPTTEIHIKELARQLGIGPRTAETYLKKYAAEGLLKHRKSANAIFYSIVNDKPIVKRLKQFYAVAWLTEIGFVEAVRKENLETTLIVLYGTYASGDYDEKSDLDIILFSFNSKFPKDAVRLLDKNASINIFTLAKWRKVSKEFRESVAKNHVVLYGSGFPV